jgi:hypothetical protein
VAGLRLWAARPVARKSGHGGGVDRGPSFKKTRRDLYFGQNVKTSKRLKSSRVEILAKILYLKPLSDGYMGLGLLTLKNFPGGGLGPWAFRRLKSFCL